MYAFIAAQLLTKKEREQYRRVFEKLDVDQSGSLTEDEFLNGTRDFFGMELTVEDAMHLYKKIDINKDGSIQFNEFVLVCLEKDELHSQLKLRSAFEMMDKNGDNTISLDELLDVFSFNKNFDMKMAKQIIKQVDKNKDGGIQFDEFCTMMRGMDFEKMMMGNGADDDNAPPIN